MVTGQKLLLADDSVTIQKVVDLTFSDEGLEVIAVGDGQQAIERLEEIVPDIVLADVFMPGLSGYQVCEHIKRSERFRHIPVMLLVGSFEPFDEAEARRVGADDYLTKPFQSIRTLIGKVRSLLSGGTSAAEAPTRQLAPPPEAERENRPDTDFLERSTADTAPLSASELAEMQTEVSSREVSFADLSMDDEMIETRPAADFSGSAGQPAARDAQQARSTVQYSASDLREAGVIAPAFESSPERQETQETSAPAPHETHGADPWQEQASESSQAPEAESPSREASGRISGLAGSDDSLLDLGDIEQQPPAMAEADDFFLDLLDDFPAQPRESAPSFTMPPAPAPPAETDGAASTAASLDAAARVEYEAETIEPATQAQEFVEAEVLAEETTSGFAPAAEEPPPAAPYQPAQETAEPVGFEEAATGAESMPTERLTDDYRAEAVSPAETAGDETSAPAEASTQAAAPAASVAGQITLEQLSPEVIDAIARRAVELMSERVVEQVAWEVVPDLAELLIKRRLEEEKKQ